MLGLTLCYEDEDEEGNTEIFLDDIHPLGLAAKDGRLRLGDQIIQVCLAWSTPGPRVKCCYYYSLKTPLQTPKAHPSPLHEPPPLSSNGLLKIKIGFIIYQRHGVYDRLNKFSVERNIPLSSRSRKNNIYSLHKILCFEILRELGGNF